MFRTRLTLVAALALVVLSVAGLLARRAALGDDIAGPRGRSAWKVTLKAVGQLADQRPAVAVAVPLEFRRQHVFDEQFASPDLMPPRKKEPPGRDPGRREVVWKRTGLAGAVSFQLTYSFRCSLGLRDGSAEMRDETRRIDAPPSADRPSTAPTPGVESDAPEVAALAAGLAANLDPVDQARALYDHVASLNDEPDLDLDGPEQTALGCLRREGGDDRGKSRLLVALCRNRGLPARPVAGLALAPGQIEAVDHWAEVWVGGRWLPMDPTRRSYDEPARFASYLVLWVGDGSLVRAAERSRYAFFVQTLTDAGTADGEPLTPLQEFFHRHSLPALRPAEQHLVKFLLMMPLAALVVAVFRTLVGVPTFGTFSPALLGLAFLDLKALPLGLTIFLATVLVGWGLRHVLDVFGLLLVPRTAVLLTLIVAFLIGVVVVGHAAGVRITHYLALFPLVILTHLVERFWTIEAEDSTTTAFKTLAGTAVVAVSISVLLNVPGVTDWMFHHPETLGLVLAAQLVLGRYSGYRVTELYRFRDLIENADPTPAQSPAAPSPNGAAATTAPGPAPHQV